MTVVNSWFESTSLSSISTLLYSINGQKLRHNGGTAYTGTI